MKPQVLADLAFLGLDGHLHRRLAGGDLAGAERALVELVEWARTQPGLVEMADALRRSLESYGIATPEPAQEPVIDNYLLLEDEAEEGQAVEVIEQQGGCGDEEPERATVGPFTDGSQNAQETVPHNAANPEADTEADTENAKGREVQEATQAAGRIAESEPAQAERLKSVENGRRAPNQIPPELEAEIREKFRAGWSKSRIARAYRLNRRTIIRACQAETAQKGSSPK